MRGRLTVGTMLAALLTNLALAGCGTALPAEVDAELTDDWVKVADVKGWRARGGRLPGRRAQGHRPATPTSWWTARRSHYAEVVHVGEFKGLTAAPAAKDTRRRVHRVRQGVDGLPGPLVGPGAARS